MRTCRLVQFLVWVSLALFSGCVTRIELPDGRIRGEAKQRLQQRRAAVMAAGKRLNADFTVAFSDPGYLSLEDTPARAALYDYFWRFDAENPSPEQFAHLVDILKRRPQLLHPLRSAWLSRQATFAQRMEVAEIIDGGKGAEVPRGKCLEELLRFLLPRERLTVDEFRKLQLEVRRNGEIYDWASEQLKKLERNRDETEKRMRTLNALREASYR